MSHQNSYVGAIILNVTVFGDGAFKQVIMAKWGHKDVALMQHDWCSRKGRDTSRDACTQRGDHRRTQGEGGRLQEERPQEKPNLPAPWPWTFSLQNYEKVRFCCLSLPPSPVFTYSNLIKPTQCVYSFQRDSNHLRQQSHLPCPLLRAQGQAQGKSSVKNEHILKKGVQRNCAWLQKLIVISSIQL